MLLECSRKYDDITILFYCRVFYGFMQGAPINATMTLYPTQSHYPVTVLASLSPILLIAKYKASEQHVSNL